MSTTTSRAKLATIAAIAGLLLAACGDDGSSSSDTNAAPTTTAAPAPTAAPATNSPTTSVAPSFEGDLVGTFAIDPGACDGTAITGSYFKMVQPGGTADVGPFIPNADSTCTDTSATVLTPGSDGGFITGDFQPAPDPAYDANGNGLAAGIFNPTPFFAVSFAGATDPADATPTISAIDGLLTGNLSAFTAYYGGASFNQGAPKPDGSGSAPTGTIDPTTGVFTLDWTSLIVGGSFDGFLGVWHFEGTFIPAA